MNTPKNPVQIRHLGIGQRKLFHKNLNGTDTYTVCGRVVVKQMTRKSPPTGASVACCPECLNKTHENKVFEIVR